MCKNVEKNAIHSRTGMKMAFKRIFLKICKKLAEWGFWWMIVSEMMRQIYKLALVFLPVMPLSACVTAADTVQTETHFSGCCR